MLRSARGRGIAGWIRAAFVVGALVGGLGVLVYLVCWLIIPDEGEEPGDLSSAWIVALAKACAACVACVALGMLAAAATLFGFGWIAVGCAAAVLIVVLAAWPRLGPAWDPSRPLREQASGTSTPGSWTRCSTRVPRHGRPARRRHLGPGGIEHRVLLIFDADSLSAIDARLAEDIWTETGTLSTVSLERWSVLLGELSGR